MVHVRIFNRVGPDDDSECRKSPLKGRDKSLEVFKNRFFMVAQAFRKLPAHAHGRQPEPWLLTRFFHRQK